MGTYRQGAGREAGGQKTTWEMGEGKEFDQILGGPPLLPSAVPSGTATDTLGASVSMLPKLP